MGACSQFVMDFEPYRFVIFSIVFPVIKPLLFSPLSHRVHRFEERELENMGWNITVFHFESKIEAFIFPAGFIDN